MRSADFDNAPDQPTSGDRYTSQEVRASDIRGRDFEILGFLEAEELTAFTFDGLRRSLRMHPETLSRSLSRLEDEGLVEKTPEGYRVTRKVERLNSIHSSASRENPIPLVQTLLPSDVELGNITSSLKGKWFGGLRWMGYSENEDALVLKWVTEDGGIQVNAKFSGESLDIEAVLKDGKKVDEAVKVAHQLMSHIAKVYSRPYRTRPVSLVMFDPYGFFA